MSVFWSDGHYWVPGSFWRLFSSKPRQSNSNRDSFRSQARPRQYANSNYSTFSSPRVQVHTRPPPPPPPPPPTQKTAPAVIRASYNVQSPLLPPPARKAVPSYPHLNPPPRQNTSPAPPIVRKARPVSYRPPTRAEVIPATIRPIFRNSTAASTIETTPLLPKPPSSRPALAATTKTLTTATTSSPVRKRTVTCYICLDVREAAATIIAPCNDHWYCAGCLCNLFTTTTKDESLFPPSCCRKPFGQSPVFLLRFLTWEQELAFLQAAQEFTTPAGERVYCAQVSCGSFLMDGGEVEMRCRKCESRTCRKCREKMHLGVCRNKEDEAMKALAEVEGWTWCKRCGRCVELLGGCNHMTCRCNFQFCYICGLEWGTCECTRETPRLGLLGARLAERQALREITRQAPANALHPARGGPARAQVARPPRVTHPENNLAAPPRAQPATPGRPPRAAPRRAGAPDAVSARRNARSGRFTRAANNVSGPERPAAVPNAVATQQGRCQVHAMWRKAPRGGTCGMCRNFMPIFIFECTTCGIGACARCSGR